MGIFDIFKKEKSNSNSTTENGILGPTFLEENIEHISNPRELHSHEWRRKLKSKNGETFFEIKYYGQLHSDYKNLIVGTDFAPAKIIAVNISNKSEYLLFDGCKHGYNAMFCDKYSDEQINNRIPDKIYNDEKGNSKFELIISTYNGIDYEDEYKDEVDSNGEIELINGQKVDFEKVKRNGFDTLQIWTINKNGNKIEIVSEELA
ncbi:hypothetical protein NQT66_13480 [Cellulophaga baltica]|uniref:hypothetical protein n=1 Tax=Cellulophaga baltica TaxID=76594 RepID=UPI002148FE83|nr:hypothetical protein [Cellulophaga baltica]MCR1025828.1 hypothetical protein [Cellulophaga baltica]